MIILSSELANSRLLIPDSRPAVKRLDYLIEKFTENNHELK